MQCSEGSHVAVSTETLLAACTSVSSAKGAFLHVIVIFEGDAIWKSLHKCVRWLVTQAPVMLCWCAGCSCQPAADNLTQAAVTVLHLAWPACVHA